MEEFEEFFGRATGNRPYPYQSRLARAGLPAVLQAPTGAGKTGIILAWLWRRLELYRHETPRRLVYALPQRSLVEQIARQAEGWLANLGLAEQVALHVVMGGEGKTQRQWRLNMHRPAIVIGTVDSLVSKALNRGYGIGRAIYPIDFALVTNGAHWVIDEIQLCPESTTTLRQLAAFTNALGTAEPFLLTCMSATIPEDLLATVDNPVVDDGQVVRIEPEERTGELATRLAGQRAVRKLGAAPGDYAAIASAIQERHRPGELTLVVMNTVEAARQVFRGLNGAQADCTLLHSRFRAVEREALIGRVTAGPAGQGHIVVATQVVEAGMDLNAAVMFTEAAPWPSVVQRAGRCNRTGRVADAELWWLPPARHHPYQEADVDAAAAGLARMEGTQVTGEDLLNRTVPVTESPVSVLRKPDLIALFDTAPDLSGADIDVAPYVRDAEDMDVQLAWTTWEPASLDGRPPDDARAPLSQWRCRVPLRDLAVLQKRTDVWRLDQSHDRWTRVTPADRARPGEVLVVAAQAGGYDPVTGFDPAARGPVPGCPELKSRADLTAGLEETFREDSTSTDLAWLSLDQHSKDVRDESARLLAELQPRIPEEAARSVVAAAYVHDIGKAHPIWQDALCQLAPEDGRDRILNERPWAKSASSEPLRFEGNVKFRHELASLLLLDGPLHSLLAGVGDPGLTRYLVLAHHGKLRVQVRVPEEADQEELAGLRHGTTKQIPSVLGHPPTQLKVDLDQFWLGGERSWTRTALALRDRYGPFVLAYLETVVRIADWRASAQRKEDQ